MFWISARVVPWRAFTSLEFPCRSTTTRLPSSTLTTTSGRGVQWSLPSGPSTCTVRPATETFTFSGMSMGFFPIRDMALPHLADDLASDPALLRLADAEDAFGGGQDRHAQAVQDPLDVV